MVKTSAGWEPASKSSWQSSKGAEKAWGKPYGLPYHSPEGELKMHRKGQKVRFFNKAGQQVGPEQANVAPAVAYAMSQNWKDRADQVDDDLTVGPKLKAQPAPAEYNPHDFGVSDPDMNDPISEKEREQVRAGYQKIAKKYGDSPEKMTVKDQNKAAKLLAKLPLRDLRGEQDQQNRVTANMYKAYNDPSKKSERKRLEKLFNFMDVYDNILITAISHKLTQANAKRAAKRPATESWMNDFRVLAENVGSTIWKQIPISTKMAVGAREPISTGRATLRFKVLRGSFVDVTLDASDTYTVEHYRVKRGTMDKVSLGKVSDVYAENLGSIVYGITHGKI